MSIESPNEGPTRAATSAFPITTEQLSAIMAEVLPAPLSPRSAQVAADSFTGLTTDMLCTVVRGLIATLCKRDIDNFAKCNKQAAHIQELKDCIKKEFEVSYDMHTCPNGFEGNDETRAPYAQVPDKEGHLILPKCVRYLDDRRIATYPMGAPIDAMPYIIDIFAEPSLDDNDEPFKPMLHWFRAAMHTDESHWQVLYKETYKITSWGIAANLKRHRDLTKVAEGLVSRIEFMQRDLEGACQAADICEYWLQAARAHKYVDHAQGLVNNGVHFTHQNVQVAHILHKNSDKGKGKAI